MTFAFNGDQEVDPDESADSNAIAKGYPADASGSKSQGSLSRAKYPVPPTLAQVLEEAVATAASPLSAGGVSSHQQDYLAAVLQVGLTHILENAIHALDQWYFATDASLRATLGNRTCLRIAGDPEQCSITITDLGVGMTRADLINLLGVGRPIPPHWKLSAADASPGNASPALSAGSGNSSSRGSKQDRIWNRKRIRHQQQQQQQQQGVGVGRLPSFSSRSTISTSTVEEDEEEVLLSNTGVDFEQSSGTNAVNSSAVPKDILGGFYAAVCALAVGVRVGTKSKFDDYYEFELGKLPNKATASQSYWKEFVITRPLGEGRVPSLENDCTRLTDVRGESGTSVTLYLHPHFSELTRAEQLLPILTKILETTQYTFALEGAIAKEEEEALIMADDHVQELLEKRELQEESSDGGPVTGAGTLRLSSQPSALSLSSKDGVDEDDSYLAVKERAKYIPVRLSLEERKLLRLVEAAMNCCEYTTSVDKPFASPSRRLHTQVKGVMSVLRGLVTACDYKAGQKLAKAEESGDDEELWIQHRPFLRKILEIARRHKIMNPEKMRTEYGKLIYLLQDIVQLQQEGHLDALFPPDNSLDEPTSLIAPIETVYKFLEDRHGLAVLDDKHIELATQEVLATPGKSRSQIDSQIRRKEKAVVLIKQSYHSEHLSMEDIHMCLYSICDNNSFLNSNRVPIDTAIQFLQQNFRPDQVDPNFSLAIVHGTDGARLNHSHERQYYFALQSLTLWREIVHDMFRLWAMTEDDLLNAAVPYKLQDTGQGMQRIQQSPRTYQAMQQILQRVQGQVKQWIGSSVIHLGDHNVPNALSFIDKYTQVPRILGPIVTCLENLEKLCEQDYGIQDMLDDNFGGLLRIKKEILHDFFRSAFDGSGADNFYDAGSCIDGRLTSAWNWCSQLPHKPFYPMFKLTGFTGFDGAFG